MNEPAIASGKGASEPVEPRLKDLGLTLALAFVVVLLTRVPVARPAAYDFDEVGYLDTIAVYRFPMHHTLFLASARFLGGWLGEAYRGFLAIDMVTSALALVATWWWLRALVAPRVALGGTMVLALAPVFWSYGAMAANYTAIPLVGSVLLGIAWRGIRAPRSWHPWAAAVTLALGAGYRQDLGTFWLPVLLVILWQHRWLRAVSAGLLFAIVNLAWFLPMLYDVGGWTAYREQSAEFAYQAGYLNSVWNLGLIDAPVRYAVKGLMALVWTVGPGLLLVPLGLVRAYRRPAGGWLMALLALSIVPALGSHLLVHFGVPGYVMHYVPAVLALLAVGVAGIRVSESTASWRLAGLAMLLGAVFWFYPTDYNQPGFRGDFDLAFARQTRLGLRTRPPLRDPAAWRTTNSQELPETRVSRASAPHRSLSEIWQRQE